MPNSSRYPTDLSDAQWNVLEPLVPKVKPGGRPLTYPRREILNAILYFKQAGCAWRLLPHDLPPRGIVSHYFRQWTRDGTWQHIHNRLRDQVRQQYDKQNAPTAAILDSQTVKLGEQGGPSGYDAGKKIKGRKRPVLVDSLGLLWGVLVTAASVQDRDGAKTLLDLVLRGLRRLQVIWADGGYAGQWVEWVKAQRPYGKLHWEIVKREAGVIGFAVVPKRWIVERTLAWLYQCRRWARDYERKTAHSEAMIQIAMIGLMARRLAKT